MSRTNKGGVRLRLITGLTAAMAIAAGIYAATLQPRAEACDIVPTALFGSKDVQVNCTGLSPLGDYQLDSNGDAVWNVSGSGDGHSQMSPHGFSSGPLTFAADGSGNATLWIKTASSGTTDSSTNVKLQDTLAQDIVSSDSVPAYYLSFTNSTLSVTHGDPMRVQVQGLIGSDAVKFGEVTSAGVPTILKFDSVSGGSGSGTSMSNFLVDSSTSPYLTPSTISASSGSISSDVYIKSASAGQTYLGVYLNGALIGQTAQFTIN